MTLEKAFQILTLALKAREGAEYPDFYTALALGAEAIKRVQANRTDPEYDHWVPLPGEYPFPTPPN